MDFTIYGRLLDFNANVVPAIGDMQSTAEDYIERFQNVADGAMTFNGDLTGNYESNSSGQFVIAGEIENTSCLGEVEALSGQLVPILNDCQKLGDMIKELEEIKAEADKLKDEITKIRENDDNYDVSIDSKGNEQKVLKASAQEAINEKEAKIKELKEKFDKLHEEAKQLLSSLEGQDVSLPEVPVLSGTLSFEPSMSALDAKGNAGYKSEFYNYQVGDQSIASISQ